MVYFIPSSPVFSPRPVSPKDIAGGSLEVGLGWQSKKFKIKASQIPRNAAYIEYVKFRWDAAQRRYWTFYEAITLCGGDGPGR